MFPTEHSNLDDAGQARTDAVHGVAEVAPPVLGGDPGYPQGTGPGGGNPRPVRHHGGGVGGACASWGGNEWINRFFVKLKRIW